MLTCRQWRTQKNFHGGVHSVAYGGHFYLVYVVCDVIRHNHQHAGATWDLRSPFERFGAAALTLLRHPLRVTLA